MKHLTLCMIGGPFILSFALGHDVSLRCVTGFPTLLSIGAAIGVVPIVLYCNTIAKDCNTLVLQHYKVLQ